MSKLVIVESPTKIKKIQQYLPADFNVDSCVGHIRDLPGSRKEIPAAIKDKPWAEFGVDIENGFKPHYITIHGKGKVIAQLKKQLKNADALYLATDEDREGESISWHLIEALNPKVPIHRMVFNEITKKAVLEAVENPRALDMNLVQAQETRRILDRLYGYALSPLLWKKVGGNLSAGRVQSVAVRLVVNRERERSAFVVGSYWDLSADLETSAQFAAKLIAIDGKRIATGKDFDKDTGKIQAGKDVVLVEEAQAKDLQARLKGAAWQVSDVKKESRQTRPKAPFITSTLQQEANNRLNMSARDAMQTAQALYQNGFITYMRTDSTALSQEALDGAKAAILAKYGESYYAGPRTYEGKKAKGAQEAHEAIRPAGEEFQAPDTTGLHGAQLELYSMIYRRTLASQMANERSLHTTITLDVEEATFTATGKKVEFAGYRRAWKPMREDTTTLPDIATGESPHCIRVEADGHETKPPARFTEASLVQALEQQGIGRPSTYASILDVIIRRGYAIRKGKALAPSYTAFAVTNLLEKFFPRLVDPTFTAAMEETLDMIASGEAQWEPFLEEFFLGEEGLQAQVAHQLETMDPGEARIIDIGKPLPYAIKIGRFGAYIEGIYDGEEVRCTIPEAITPDELDEATMKRLIADKAAGPVSIGDHPKTKEPIYVLEGRYGPYYQLGDGDKPKRASLPKGKTADMANFDEAVFLLSLPLTLGSHPDGGEVVAGLGRFGPFVAMDRDGKPDYRSIPKGMELTDVTLEDAIDLLNKPKGVRGAKVIREVGKHPKDGANIQLLSGKYGPYVKHGKTNASLPKNADPEKLSIEEAVELLAARRQRKR